MSNHLDSFSTRTPSIRRVRYVLTPIALSAALVVAALALFHQTALAGFKFSACGAGGCGSIIDAIDIAAEGDGVAVMIPARDSLGVVITKSVFIQGGWMPPGGICDVPNQVFTDTDGLFIYSPITLSVLTGFDVPVLTISHTGQLTIEQVELQSLGLPVERGAGISATLDGGAHVLLNRVAITGGVATEVGGGMYFELRGGSTLVISDSQILSNSAPYGGGMEIRLFDTSSLIIRNSEIMSNVAGSGDGAGARILVESGYVTITGSTIDGNRASGQGGGIAIESLGGPAHVFLERNLIRNNESGGQGGGVYISPGNITVTVIDSSAISNVAGLDGGGLFVAESRLELFNSTLSHNQATGNGGGLAIEAGVISKVRINNSTVASNTAGAGVGDGGGIWIADNLSATVEIANSIIAANVDVGGQAPDCFGGASLASFGHNLVGDGSGCGWTAAAGDQVGEVGAAIDPLLDDLTGQPAYHPLQVDSPAVNAGNPLAPGGDFPACRADDQPGTTRPIGDACDIGAYERPDDPIVALSAVNSGPTALGELTVLTATVTGGSGLIAYEWDLDDGTIVAGRVVSHTYALPGVYTAVVTATNSSSVIAAATVVTVTAQDTIANTYLPAILR